MSSKMRARTVQNERPSTAHSETYISFFLRVSVFPRSSQSDETVFLRFLLVLYRLINQFVGSRYEVPDCCALGIHIELQSACSCSCMDESSHLTFKRVPLHMTTWKFHSIFDLTYYRCACALSLCANSPYVESF